MPEVTEFSLHSQLAADTFEVGTFTLSRVLLMNDSNYPWLILVPARAGVREMHELAEADQQQLMYEITHTSKALEALTGADKMNVAALGNMVPQLHVHIIARFKADPAWPGPVWGKVPSVPYSDLEAPKVCGNLREALL
ncbi:HIT domain-containing protein [Kordiimonas pumila]|uniref:HIT domain-containing protein n=1 Tax=Kordiimonas pumila TaxID=2161677 RepID=A0ABV7D561_9PROT|nr:HIT domain-containing protein [Kordiimonas pumila]